MNASSFKIHKKLNYLFSPLVGQLSFLLLSATATIALWYILVQRTPLYEKLPWYFWKPTNVELPFVWLIIPILASNLILCFTIQSSKAKPILLVFILILAGMLNQHMFALMEGRGLDGLRDKIIYTGHAKFAQDATTIENSMDILTRYREMVNRGELSTYPHAGKPPGNFLFYIALERVARTLSPWKESSFTKLTYIAVFICPLLTYLCLIPIFTISRLYLPEKIQYIPLLLFITIPNINLITLHLDQCLYPSLFLFPIAFFLTGLHAEKWRYFLFSGAMTACSLFISFSLLPLPVFIFTLTFYPLLRIILNSNSSQYAHNFQIFAKKALISLLLFICGFLLIELLLYFLFGYNIIDDYHAVMSAHQNWKIKEWTIKNIFYFAFLDIFEFTIWVGTPVMSLALLWMAKSWNVISRTNTSVYDFGFSLSICLIVLSFFAKTASETGRLWIFLVPCLVIGVAYQIQNLTKLRLWNVIILTTQLTSTLLVKIFQDFR